MDRILLFRKNIFFFPLLVFALIGLVKDHQPVDHITPTPDAQVPGKSENNSLSKLSQVAFIDYPIYLPFIKYEIPAYYVSPSGDDLNPGTFNQPWRTIQHAADRVLPGDTVYIRGGIYHEAIFTSNGGTEGHPIRYLAYPGETPVMDGENHLPPWSEALFTLYEEANYVEISGLEIRNSTYNGVLAWGSHITLDKLYVHHTQSTGILVIGNYAIIENCRVNRTNLNNEYGVLPSNWGAGIEIAGTDNSITQYGVIRNCTSWENWGEGINTHQSNHVMIEENIVHDSFSTNIYISDATNALVQRNFVYTDPTSYLFDHGAQVGIMMGDETYLPPSANNTIINNIAYGNNRNFYWWQGDQGGGMINVLIANNTFINSVKFTGVKINRGAHQNVRITNNIIEQDGLLPITEIIPNPELHFSNNLWSKDPDASASGPGDIIGNPLLAKTGEPYNPQWFLLTGLSPAVDNALSLPEVALDYFGFNRGPSPDIGAVEYIPNP